MPQYEMDGKYEPAFTALDEFTQAYIEAMFWTEEAPGVSTEEWQATDEHDEGSIPSDVGFADLAPEALAVIIETCREFQESFKEELDLAYSMRDGYTPSSAGMISGLRAITTARAFGIAGLTMSAAVSLRCHTPMVTQTAT